MNELVVLALALWQEGPSYLPFSPQETLNVELVATWSDGDSVNTGYSVTERAGYVYLALGGGGLAILDARYPEDSIVEVYRVDSLPFRGVGVKDSFLFAFSGNGRFDCYSIADPDSPVFLSRTMIYKSGKDEKQTNAFVYIVGNYAYVTAGTSGPYIVDISNPDSIFLTGTGYFSARQVAFTPPCYLYTASWGAIFILDVSDPANPVCVDTFGLGNGWETIETEGNLLVATAGNVAEAYDISDPLNPVYLHGGIAGWWIHDILMRRNGSGTRLLYTAGDDYFLVYDVTDGSAPIRVGEMTWVVPNPTTIFWDRGYTYISNNYYGQELYILHYLGDTIIPPDTSDTSEHYLDWMRTVYERPGLDFLLSREAYVSFSLYNTTGQKIYSQDLGLLEPGPHQITIWGPRPGLYFIFLRINEQRLYRKLLFTKPQG